MKVCRGGSLVSEDQELSLADIKNLSERTHAKCQGYLVEVHEFRFEYNVELIEINNTVLYNDLRTIRHWRNRLADIMIDVGSMVRALKGISIECAAVAKLSIAAILIAKAAEHIGKGWAYQERLAHAELLCLGSMKVARNADALHDYADGVQKILRSKQFDLKDANEEVSSIQVLLSLAVGTSE